MTRPRHALRHWSRWGRVVQDAERLLLLTDFDGTIASIKARPDEVRLDAGTAALLRRVSRLEGVRVGVVSGRSLAALRRFVRVPGLVYVGNHGLEIHGPGMRFVHPSATRTIPTMGRIARQLQAAVQGVSGALVEFKRLSLSVHWRNVPARRVPQFHRRIQAVLSPWVARRAVRVTRGKRVIEVRPPGSWDKGSAVEWLVRASRCRRGHVLYAGDDRTDEDAFRAVNRYYGISIFVGERRRPTAARWWLRNPQEVSELLAHIGEERWSHHPRRLRQGAEPRSRWLRHGARWGGLTLRREARVVGWKNPRRR